MAGAPQGYIGRNPSDGRTTINRQRFTVATGVQTSFTFTTGYDLGYLDVYLNGVRQVESLDYSASDGSTFSFGVSTPAVQGDTIEAVAYKSFNMTNVTGSTKDFSVGRNLDVTGNVTIGSSLTIASDLVVNGTYTYVNTEVLEIEDKTVGIASTSAASNTTADGAGIVVYGGSDGDKSLLWDKDLSNWVLSGGGISLGTGVTISTPATNVLAFSIDGAVNAKLNNFGAFIVGDGVTGEAWDNAYKAVQVGSGGFIGQVPGASASSYWTNNAYFDSVNSRWEYIAADEATKLESTDGVLTWMNASAGSADGAITWSEKLRINSSGYMGIGAVNPTYALMIQGSGNAPSGLYLYNNTGGEGIKIVPESNGNCRIYANTNDALCLGTNDTDRITIDADGGNTTFTSNLTIPDKIIHAGDTNTAIRFPAADTFTVETGGTERLRVTSDGITKFDDYDGTAGKGRIEFGNSGEQFIEGYDTGNAGSGSYLRFGDGSTERMRIDNAGLVGIGTITPAAELSIYGDSDTAIRLTSTAGEYASIQFGDINDTVRGGITYYSGDNSLQFRGYNNSERMRLDSGGRILINQTSNYTVYADSKLQISATDGTAALSVTRWSDNGSSPYLNLGKSRGGIGSYTIVQDDDRLGQINFVGADGTDLASPAAGIAGYVDGTPGSNDMPGRLVFFTASDGGVAETERMRIDSVGRLLVNTTSAMTTGSNDLRDTIQATHTAGAQLLLARNDTATVTSNRLGEIAALGNDADGTYQVGGSIRFEADANHGDNDKPTRIVFKTCADGSATNTERMRINSDGKLLIERTVSSTSGDHPALQVKTTSSGTENSSFATGIDFYQDSIHKKRLVITKGNAGTGGGDWIFYEDQGNTKQLELQDGGDVEVSDGDLIIGTAAHGIDFTAQTASAITGASASNEVLDHYEAGSWAPTIVSGGWTLDTNPYSRYVRVGNLVHAQLYIGLSGTGNSDMLKLGGLPFAAGGNGYSVGSVDFGQGGFKGTVMRTVSGANTLTFLYSSENTSVARYSLNGNQVGSSYIIATISYVIDGT